MIGEMKTGTNNTKENQNSNARLSREETTMDYNFYGHNFRESGMATFTTKRAAAIAAKSANGVRPFAARAATRFHYFWIVVAASLRSLPGVRFVAVLQKDGSMLSIAHPGYRVGDTLVSAE
jgi:hypothetical protein